MDVIRPVPKSPTINTTITTTVKQPAKPVDVTPPAPVTTVKQQQSPPVVTVKVTEPIDVTPAVTSDTVTKTKPSEDVVPSTEPIDDDSSNDLVVVVVVVVVMYVFNIIQ